MATVHARKRGNKWEYRFEAAAVGGQRKQICKSGYLTKKEAMEAGAKAYNEYTQAGAVFTPNNSSYADYLDYWLSTYCKNNLKSVTHDNYIKKIRLYIKPHLGRYMLSSLTPAVLQDFINKIFNEGYSRNTLTVIKGILSNSLSYAVEPLHYLQSSPMTYVKLPSTRAKPAIPFRSEPHIYIDKGMIEKIFERFPEGSSAHIPLMLGYKCGLRLGEAFGLVWSDIDFECHRIRVYKTLNRTTIYFDEGKNRLEKPESVKQITTPKKKASYRWIPMTEGVELAFHSWEKKQIADKEKSGSSWGKENPFLKDFPDLVFTTQPGGVFLPQYANAECSRIISIIEKKEIELAEKENREPRLYEVYPHKFRHTFVTKLNESNMSPFTVSKIVGHTSVNMTNYYTHLEQDYVADEFRKFAAKYDEGKVPAVPEKE